MITLLKFQNHPFIKKFYMNEQEHQKQTLVSLTKKLIDILSDPKTPEIELSKAEQLLNASKRRIYDIANVLSGIGIVERCGKSRIKLTQKAKDNHPGMNNHHSSLLIECKEYDSLNNKMDTLLFELLSSDQFNIDAWLTPNDISNIYTDSPMKYYALTGPQSMTVQIEEEEDGLNHIVCCSHDEIIQLTPISIPQCYK